MSDPDEALQAEIDALDLLPLSIIPIKNRRLKRARIVKNARMEGVVELFSGDGVGRGYVTPDELLTAIDFRDDEIGDVGVVRELSRLPSYDVFSLRVQLRKLEIDTEGIVELQLSPARSRQLASYMTHFTRPLIYAIYGGDNRGGTGHRDIIQMFAAPDIARARDNLVNLANALDIEVDQIPEFLLRYGDVYLCLSYYQEVLDSDMTLLKAFLRDLEALERHNATRSQPQLQAQCERVRRSLRHAVTQLGGVLDAFKDETSQMWEQITGERFRAVEELIGRFHTTIGAALCIIDVKMKAWAEKFPNPGLGSIANRTNFLISEIRPGLESLIECTSDMPEMVKWNLEREPETLVVG